MSVSQELAWLISQIRNTSQPRERLRLLALGWRTLRGLNPADRVLVARELGIEGAEQLVEQLGRRGGASPALLLEALGKAKYADPAQLGDVVQGLLDPDRRSDSVGQLMHVAADWLSGETDAVEPGDVEISDPVESVPESVPPPPPAPLEIIDIESPPEEAADEEPDVEAEVMEVGEEEILDDVPAAPTVEEEAAPEQPPIPGEREEVHATVAEEPSPSSQEGLAAPSARFLDSVAGKLTAVAPLTARFRVLAEIADDLASAGARQLDEIIEIFPAGWARRRAIETLLRAGVPRRFTDALELVTTLERPSERMWALSTLATSRELDEQEREQLLEAVGPPMVARRLRLRMS